MQFACVYTYKNIGFPVCRAGVGASGSLQMMYYCDVTDADLRTAGGGIDDELIEVVEYSLDQARDMVKQGANVPSPPSCLMGILWFLCNKAPNKSKI